MPYRSIAPAWPDNVLKPVPAAKAWKRAAFSFLFVAQIRCGLAGNRNDLPVLSQRCRFPQGGYSPNM